LNFLQKRRARKLMKHLLHEAQHTRHMREDVAAPERVAQLQSAEQALEEAWRGGEEAPFNAAVDGLSEGIQALRPPTGTSQARVREYVEIIAVALAVAMGLRAYFIQPFKIPTGSMQPTLNGIQYEPVEAPGLFDRVPLRLVKYLVTGKSFHSAKSEHTGIVTQILHDPRNHLVGLFFNNGSSQRLDSGLHLQVEEGQMVERGQVVATGRKIAGDHIFVDKVRYNFFPPKRGDIFVFDTQDLKHPHIQTNSFYIKRLCGLPNETIQVQPPYLVVNGERVTEPYPFQRIAEKTEPGYNGYVLAQNTPSLLYFEGAKIQMGPDDYLPMGDNSQSSLDGRYFGPVKEKRIVGPAFFVYWPFGAHWGLCGRKG